MIRLIGRLLRERRGGTAVEYGLILALVVLMMIGALVLFASTTIDIWTNVATKVVGAR